jgi:hypothetical protein
LTDHGDFVDSLQGSVGVPPPTDGHLPDTEFMEGPPSRSRIALGPASIIKDSYHHTASRSLRCPYCATSLQNWQGLSVVGEDDAPVFINFHGTRLQVDPSLLMEPDSEVQYQLSGLRAYRRCPSGHKLPLDYGKRPVLLIPVIGLTGAGKTAFLAALHQLIMRGAFSQLGWHITLEDAPGVASYARSLENYVSQPRDRRTETDGLLIYRIFPVGSRQTSRYDTGFNLVIFDIPGERYVSGVNPDPRVVQLSIADGLLMVVDATDLSGSTRWNQYGQIANRIFNQLDDSHPYFRRKDRTSSWQCVPLAVGIAKSDLLPARLDRRMTRITDGPQYVLDQVDENASDQYCAGFLLEAGGEVGETLIAQVMERFIYTSWAFISSWSETGNTTQAINTLYLFSRLLSHVVGLVNVVEDRYRAGE